MRLQFDLLLCREEILFFQLPEYPTLSLEHRERCEARRDWENSDKQRSTAVYQKTVKRKKL